jgi:hypothetical protein
MYTDDAVSGVSTVYTQPSWSFRSLFVALYGSYQLTARPLTNNVGLTLAHSYQAASYLRFGVAANNHARLTTTTSGALPSTFAMTIVRTK